MKAFTPVSSEASSLTHKKLTEIQKKNFRLKQELDTLKKLWPYLRKSKGSRAQPFYPDI